MERRREFWFAHVKEPMDFCLTVKLELKLSAHTRCKANCNNQFSLPSAQKQLLNLLRVFKLSTIQQFCVLVFSIPQRNINKIGDAKEFSENEEAYL